MGFIGTKKVQGKKRHEIRKLAKAIEEFQDKFADIMAKRKKWGKVGNIVENIYGTAGQILQTNGAGVLSFVDKPADGAPGASGISLALAIAVG